MEVEGEERILGPGGLFHVESTTPRRVSNASETRRPRHPRRRRQGRLRRARRPHGRRRRHRAPRGVRQLRIYGLTRREDQVAGEQPRAQPRVASADVAELDVRRSRRAAHASRRGRTCGGASGRPRAGGRAGSEAGSARGTRSAPSRPALPGVAARAGSPRRARPGTGGARRAHRRRRRRSSRPRTAAAPRRSPARGSIPSAAAFSSADASTSRPTTEFPSRKWRVSAPERQPRSSTRFPRADGRDEQRDALGDEDEVALVSALAMVLFVAVAERAHAEPTAASCPSDAIVLRRPSSSAISGAQPRICFARVMSGWRTCGSSTGSAS